MLDNDAVGGDDETATVDQVGEPDQVADQPAAKKTAAKKTAKKATKKSTAKRTAAKKTARKPATKTAADPLPLDDIDAGQPADAALRADPAPTAEDDTPAAVTRARAATRDPGPPEPSSPTSTTDTGTGRVATGAGQGAGGATATGQGSDAATGSGRDTGGAASGARTARNTRASGAGQGSDAAAGTGQGGDAATGTGPTDTATGTGPTDTAGQDTAAVTAATGTGPTDTSGQDTAAVTAATGTGPTDTSGQDTATATGGGRGAAGAGEPTAAGSDDVDAGAETGRSGTRGRGRRSASARAAGPPETTEQATTTPDSGEGAAPESGDAATTGGGSRSSKRGGQARRSRSRSADAAEAGAEAEQAAMNVPAARRGSASRPPGPPEPGDDPLAAVFLPPRPASPASAVDEDDEDDETKKDAPQEPVARKRGSRKAAVSTPEPDEDDEPQPGDADDSADTDTDADTDDDDADGDRPRRRRRRGGRGRRRRSGQRDAEAQDADDADDTDDAGETADQQGADSGDGDEPRGGSRRRRRRRRRAGAGDGPDGAPDDPPNTVVKVREPRENDPNDEVTALKGSTRLEAKRQRRREGRDPGRRRAPVLTESEFLARREAVERVMVIRQVGDRTQIAILEDGVLAEHYVERGTGQSYVGNVYLGRVQNVLPSMEAAFIDIGRGRNAVLYAGEVNFAGFELGNQPKRIESVLKSGQSVLVQVTKGPVGQKGARLTSQIGLPGRYLVYSPEGASAGISRKLPDRERDRLKSVLKKTLPENGGVIVRTAAEGASEDELSRDVGRLVAQWDTIQSKAKSANAPALLYEEPDLTVRVIRDAFNEDFSKLVVAGDDSWQMIEPYVQHVAPHLAERVEKWTDAKDVFKAYRIDEQLAKALDRKVWLPSGGSLVIDRTEAMTVIDVNTGKFTGQGGNLEETVTRNNLEAAEEIVRQLRLRDIGGIVVVDFIDMVLESNRDLVLRRLVECLARDRTRHQVAEVTSLGLVQMTRKRIGQGLLEAFSKPCDCCDGRGLHTSLEPVEPERGGGSNNNRGGGRGKGKKQSQNQPKQHSDAPEKIAAIAAASG